MRRLLRWWLVLGNILVAATVPGWAQQPGTDGGLPEILGPPPPPDPEVFAKDADGRVTLRAHRLTAPLTLDGAIDEAIYRQTKPIDHWVQREPTEGVAATERTHVWIFFDDDTFYVSAYCYDSEPLRLVANERRRDHFNIFQNDHMSVVVDPFYSRRSGYFFQTNALGALRDQEVTDERNNNQDWNTVWDTRSRILDDGWSFEMAIPFKSLRYRSAGPQIWGFNMQRVVRWKNETMSIAALPAAGSFRAIYKLDLAATLVGVETPASSRNLELKPYAIAAVTTNRAVTPPVTNELSRDAGVDAKYGLTRGLTADFTYRTDFSQVEEDQQQVNLTRFSLFFPEKRDFFLEGQGIFGFGAEQRGGGSGGGGGGGGGFAGRNFTPTLAPIVFFSRRIGLEDGVQVPIIGGGRLTGRAGRYTVGALSIQTRRAPTVNLPSTNFSVARLRRDILRRSNVGLIMTRRQSEGGAPANTVIGADATLAFFQNVSFNAFYARSQTVNASASASDASSYRGEFEYAGDRYGLKYEHLVVGDRFDPQIGFLRRQAFRRNYGQLRFSPRPRSSRWVRKHSWEIDFDQITDNHGRLETEEVKGSYRLELNNNDSWAIDGSRNFELLTRDFQIVRDVTIPIGEYRFADFRTTYQFGPQRRVSGSVTAGTGSFYGGTQTELGARAFIDVTSQLSLEPSATFNVIHLPQDDLVTKLVSTRVNYTLSARALLSAFLQFNSTTFTVSSSVRLRWEYRPGSDFFVVYSDGRDTDTRGFPLLQNRSFVVKLTRLFRF